MIAPDVPLQRELRVVASEQVVGHIVGLPSGTVEYREAADGMWRPLRARVGDDKAGRLLLEEGWSNGYLYLTPLRPVEEQALTAATVTTFHLPDKHDQSTHGRGGKRKGRAAVVRPEIPAGAQPLDRDIETDEPDPSLQSGLDAKAHRAAVAMGDRLTQMSDEEIAVEWVRLAAEPDNAAAVAALDAELARREGVTDLTVVDDPWSRQIDQLVARGWSYTDAYAEAHGLDPVSLAQEERSALIERRPGERTEDAIRRLYSEFVHVQWLDAEDATAGNLLSKAGRTKGITPTSLWSGQAARAAKYASDELKSWWEEHGGRRTYAQFRAQYVGGAEARQAAEASRLAGAGRDYGV
jgi:hypothetical protein